MDLAEIFFLIIDQNQRGQGIGSFLLKEIEDALRRSDITLVRSVLPLRDDLERLYSKAGYELFDGESEYAIPFNSLHYSANYRKQIEGKNPLKAAAYNRLSPGEKRLVNAFLRNMSITETAVFENDVSSAVVADGRVSALLLCEIVTGACGL